MDLQLAITVATVLLNLALAIAVGATLAWLWLANGASAWCSAQLCSVRRARLSAIAAAIIALGMLLLFVSAAMAEVPLLEAGEHARTMLTESHFGFAWRIGMGALLAAGILAEVLPAGQWRRTGMSLSLLALAVFLYSRSMVSHASANGDFNAAMAADWIHLCLISVWVGEVFVSGLLTLRQQAAVQEADRADMARYIENLSTSATFALGGIFMTGLFSAWHNLGSVAGLAGNSYGTALTVKLGMVVLAVLLGTFNRFIVMPSLLARLRNPGQQTSAELGRFTSVLRIEAVVLLGVLVAAAVLSATSPPTAA
ncbi:copper resistance D family protein [Massilia sp. TWP1-3-3]|uniref:copper resistance D family protein n=1 Tax=Massilia sp. TWP1-3-3 TaxID=2804573 RepID=UPI003CE965E1